MNTLNTNQEIVGEALNILRNALNPYLIRELSAVYGDDWWQNGVLNKLRDDTKFDLPAVCTDKEAINILDVSRCLRIIDVNWNDVFRRKMSSFQHSWLKETIDNRNKWAHLGGKDFSDSDTKRALDTMARLSEQIDNECTIKIRDLLRKVTYGSEEGSIAAGLHQEVATEGILRQTESSLKSWREVMQPHPDVAQGRYKNAEFAADLAQVARGEGSMEYADPVEFFARTYMTEGMTGLLVQAIKRVTGQDGDPVVQLKTSFGGGKTHSMLALYHLFHGQVQIERSDAIQNILHKAGATSLPKVHIAVVVGTAVNPAQFKRPPTMPGITVNTLWGEIAYQLALSAKRPELYDYIKEADKKGVAPGSQALQELFDSCGSCLILIDELVAYAKKLYGVEHLPAGSFDNLITFIQELTEAAKASKSSMVVASLPESELEIGGKAGELVLEQIEHTFGRMESVWKPVTASESFEVVRRRLFLECNDEKAREIICSAFSKMYNQNRADFPAETKDIQYKQRMLSCYPIHPEFFDYLYDKWAVIEKFQKTRGVLRLMAGVVYYLWIHNDASCMIMPGSLPINSSEIRDELTRYLPENWNAIVDTEVDGSNSIPHKIDTGNTRFGQILASCRLARTIFLGSAPSVREQTLRGINDVHLHLGTVLPGENIAVFNDAIQKLKSELSYLYTNDQGTRFWYDNRPTLRKIVKERAEAIPENDVLYVIEQQLRAWPKGSVFSGVHICPSTSADIPDEQSVRLVVLPVGKFHERNTQGTSALQFSEEILEHRGSSLRIYKNMLVFLAPDKDKIFQLKKIVRQYLAWQEIQKEAEQRNLDAMQLHEVKSRIIDLDKTVKIHTSQVYTWVFSPYIDSDGDLKKIQWDIDEITCMDGDNIQKTAEKLKSNENLIDIWGPPLLLMYLDRLLWKNQNDISVKTLWDDLTSYCYLPRLCNRNVLIETICKAVTTDEYFAVADGISKEGYLRLRFNTHIGFYDVGTHTLIVKRSIDIEQITKEKRQKDKESSGSVTQPTNSGSGAAYGPDLTTVSSGEPDDSNIKETSESVQPANKHFFLSVPIDTIRVNKDINKYMDEIIQHLMNQPGAKTSIKLEVQIELPEGTPQNVVRTVNENCRVLHVDDKDYGFDD